MLPSRVEIRTPMQLVKQISSFKNNTNFVMRGKKFVMKVMAIRLVCGCCTLCTRKFDVEQPLEELRVVESLILRSGRTQRSSGIFSNQGLYFFSFY